MIWLLYVTKVAKKAFSALLRKPTIFEAQEAADSRFYGQALSTFQVVLKTSSDRGLICSKVIRLQSLNGTWNVSTRLCS